MLRDVIADGSAVCWSSQFYYLNRCSLCLVCSAEQMVSRKDHQARGLQPSDDGYLSSFPESLITCFFSIFFSIFTCLFPFKVGQVCSFLVRPSDNTPGDYSLFFRTSEIIQRFKISPTPNNQYMMGGRYYNRYVWQCSNLKLLLLYDSRQIDR